MTTNDQKQEILQSLNSLDAVQSEKVLDFIHTLLCSDHQFRCHNRKRRAMKEINQALRQMNHLPAAGHAVLTPKCKRLTGCA